MIELYVVSGFRKDKIESMNGKTNDVITLFLNSLKTAGLFGDGPSKRFFYRSDRYDYDPVLDQEIVFLYYDYADEPDEIMSYKRFRELYPDYLD